jgi:exoribonuclease II
MADSVRHPRKDRLLIKVIKPQAFSLIVTIADPEKKVQVYDEMAQIVHNRFHSQNLTVRATARVRTQQ